MRSRTARAFAMPSALAGGGLCAAFALLGVLGPWLVRRDPLEQDLSAFLQPPSVALWFGTDDLGRDLFHEERISKTGLMSCATCHDLDHFGTDGRVLAENGRHLNERFNDHRRQRELDES